MKKRSQRCLATGEYMDTHKKKKKKVEEKATNSNKKNDDLFYTRSCEPS